MQNSIGNDTSYKVIKLTNGEDIIATLTTDGDNNIEIQNPLLMIIIPQMSELGVHESLNLSRWMEPYAEQKYINISKSAIITMANASPGLSRYYEYFLNKLEDWLKNANNLEPKLLMENYSKEEIYDDILDVIETESKSIH